MARLYQHWLIQQWSLALLLQFLILIIYATHGTLVDEGGDDTESPMFTPQQMCFFLFFQRILKELGDVFSSLRSNQNPVGIIMCWK